MKGYSTTVHMCVVYMKIVSDIFHLFLGAFTSTWFVCVLLKGLKRPPRYRENRIRNFNTKITKIEGFPY